MKTNEGYNKDKLIPVPEELKEHVKKIIAGYDIDKSACLENAISDHKECRKNYQKNS